MPEQSTGLKFDLEWRISLVTAMLLPALILLGVWQMQRAQEKAALADTWELRRQLPKVELITLDRLGPESLAYLPVELTGKFSEKQYFLLDNRIHGGRFGYEVLAIFLTTHDQRPVLVNRGWIEADPGRLILPEVPTVTGEVTIGGHIYVAPGKPFLLAEQTLASEWPQRIQAVEMEKLWAQLESDQRRKAYPFPVRIDAVAPGALTVDWTIVNVSPEKHTGYAVQWFVMATVLGLYYILRCSNLWQLIYGGRRTPE